MKVLRNILFLILAALSFHFANAQGRRLQAEGFRLMAAQEDTLKLLSNSMIQDIHAADRMRADSSFIRTLMRTLKTPYSFYYPFDSLQTVSILYPPDSSFRIFTWQFMKDEDYFRQRGMIQMNTSNGEFVRHALFDISEFTDRPQDSVRTPMNWIGAIYYKVIQKKHQGKKFYTLIGYDDNNIRSTKKWIEVLHFDEMGQPKFGGNFFSFRQDTVPKPDQIRFELEYKKEGRARLMYDEEMDIILYDHLVSEVNEPTKKYTLIPDGDYEGFAWKNGQWLHIDKVFTFKLKDGEAPVGEGILGDDGTIDEQKLEEHSERNRRRKRN